MQYYPKFRLGIHVTSINVECDCDTDAVIKRNLGNDAECD